MDECSAMRRHELFARKNTGAKQRKRRSKPNDYANENTQKIEQCVFRDSGSVTSTKCKPTRSDRQETSGRLGTWHEGERGNFGDDEMFVMLVKSRQVAHINTCGSLYI